MRIMNRLPHESWELGSPLDSVELALRLKPRLEEHGKWWWQGDWSKFPVLRGSVSFKGFTACFERASRHRPVEIVGRFHPNGDGTRIQIRMMPLRLTMLFLLMWMLALGFICIVMVYSAYGDGQWDRLFVPGLMEVGGFLILCTEVALYRYKAPEVKKLLAQLFAEVHDDAARNVPLQPMDNTKPPPWPAQSKF